MNLIICDIDEVVLHYFRYLRTHIGSLQIDLVVDGNDLKLKDSATGKWLKQEQSDLVSDEILSSIINEQEVIDGATECLHQLSKDNEIIFLTNVREHLFARRKARLLSYGLPYKVVANEGGKGHFVLKIVQEYRPEHVTVIDDSTRQLSNIEKHVPGVDLIRAILTSETQATPSSDLFDEACSWNQILVRVEAAQRQAS